MSKITRWGILGTGKVARDFAQDLKLLSEAQLWAVSSRTLAKAELFGNQFNATKIYSDYESLVQDPNIDVVYVATPNERHKQDCLLCLNAGKSVLCEKPFTLNAQEAQEVITVAREKNLFCMEAMWMRFNPLIKQVKSLIDEGEIGTIRAFIADFGYPVPFDVENRFFSQPGGGALLDRGVYLLSLAFYLFGEPDSIISQVSLAPTGVDEQCSISLNYTQGLHALLFTTLKTYGNNEAIIMGDQGKIKLEDPFYCPYRLSINKYPSIINVENTLYSVNFKQKLLDSLKQNSLIKSLYLRFKTYLSVDSSQKFFSSPQGNGYCGEVREVIKCLNNGLLESQVMPLDETLKIMKTIDLIRSQWLSS